MSLDTNTWYSVQSFGTDYNLAVSNSTAGSSVFSQSDSTADNALWQVNPAGGGSPSYLRTKQTGAEYCLSGSGGQLSIAQCSGSEAWTVALFNGQDQTEGYYLAPGTSSSSPRLNEAESGNSVSLQTYSGSSANDAYFQWAFRSVSAINDSAYSAIPTGSSTSTSTTTASTTTTTTTTSGSSTSSTSSQAPVSSSSASASSTTMSNASIETFTHTVSASTTTTPPNTQTVTVTGSTTIGSTSPITTTSARTSPSTVPLNKANNNNISTHKVYLLGLLGAFIGMNMI